MAGCPGGFTDTSRARRYVAREGTSPRARAPSGNYQDNPTPATIFGSSPAFTVWNIGKAVGLDIGGFLVALVGEWSGRYLGVPMLELANSTLKDFLLSDVGARVKKNAAVQH